MQISKLIKIQHKTSDKATAVRNDIAVNVIESINSAHGIARVLHSRAHLAWNKKEEKNLRDLFKTAVTKAGGHYVTLNQDLREVLIQKVASDANRSPLAVLIRLKAIGAYPSSARGVW